MDFSHEIYIILDEDFNFSSHVGIPVNGIIGYHFFKNNPLKIDFERHIITVYNRKYYSEKTFRKFEKLPISVESQKPYHIAEVQQTKVFFPAKMLIDLGNSLSTLSSDASVSKLQPRNRLSLTFSKSHTRLQKHQAQH